MSTLASDISGSVPPERENLHSSYRPLANTFDEMMAPDGTIRPRWQPFIEAFESRSVSDRLDAHEAAARMLRENDVTHMVAIDEKPANRPWQLDLFPLLISEAEWKALEAGLIQRTNLLNTIVGDLYGEQRLLKEGLLPPALVFGNPAFLRPCHGIKVPEDVHLHFIAYDLARSPDGRWWVLSDRTQAPFGVGHALENRIIVSRCLPNLFNQSNVQRLASFFRAFSDNCLRLSRHDEPLIVMLSPGQLRASYYEHAYLARYLGFTLVDGSDLTVRDDRLFLKTVEGLKPVDLVLRRIDSELCDPLELRTDSTLGVPGLVQAVRSGNVTVANTLGSGVVENEALLSFMPFLCRALFDEELKLPSVATWWCGQDRERAYVLDNLDRLITRKVFSRKTMLTPGHDSWLGSDLTETQLMSLGRQIMRRGYEYIGQEFVSFSTAPVWTDVNRLQPAPITLRVFVAATENGYQVMPGGLVRAALNVAPHLTWLEAGDLSKDAWVLSQTPVDTFSMLPQAQHEIRLRRGGRNLPSRSADNLFWLGRYTERSESVVRLLRSMVARMSGEGGAGTDSATRDSITAVLVAQGHLSAARGRRAGGKGIEAIGNELWTILFDPECPDGLVNIFQNVRRTAAMVRERLSFDTWQILKDLSDISTMERPAPGQEIRDAMQLLDRMVRYLAALNGMIMENMTRGFGWRFLDMGRRLERVRHTCGLVRDLTVRSSSGDAAMLGLLLELVDSTMTYRTRYMATPQLAPVLDLVLADETNPRSVLFQLDTLEAHFNVLPSEYEETILSPAQRLLTGLCTELQLADTTRLSRERTKSGVRTPLDRLMRRVIDQAGDMSDLIAGSYFSHSAARQISGPQRLGGTDDL